VALVRTDVSEEPGTSFIRVTKIGELGTTQAATSNRAKEGGKVQTGMAKTCREWFMRAENVDRKVKGEQQ
jgi:hypothetical protein